MTQVSFMSVLPNFTQKIAMHCKVKRISYPYRSIIRGKNVKLHIPVRYTVSLKNF